MTLMEYLKKWHATTVQTKLDEGRSVNLTFGEWFTLFSPEQLARLNKAIATGRLGTMQHKDKDTALVATWKSYAACSTNEFTVDTAAIATRRESERMNLPKPGDTLRASHSANIKKALTGLKKSAEHAQAISEGKKGQKIARWSDERKAARRAQLAAKKAC